MKASRSGSHPQALRRIGQFAALSQKIGEPALGRGQTIERTKNRGSGGGLGIRVAQENHRSSLIAQKYLA
jgi:hypothetical protein